MAGSHEVDRRGFVKIVTAFLGTIIGGVIALPGIGYVIGPAAKAQETDAWISLGPLENYPDGVPTPFNFTRSRINGWEKTVNSYGVFVLRRGDQVKVISNICTHLSCRVNWKEEENGYHCPCHDALFEIDGGIVRGPQPRPLDQYTEIKIEEGNVLFHFTKG